MMGATPRLHERAHLLDDRLFLGGQDVGELIEVAVRWRDIRAWERLVQLLGTARGETDAQLEVRCERIGNVDDSLAVGGGSQRGSPRAVGARPSGGAWSECVAPSPSWSWRH
jgi:hypothetical protein